jgi:hypothetical protein
VSFYEHIFPWYVLSCLLSVARRLTTRIRSHILDTKIDQAPRALTDVEELAKSDLRIHGWFSAIIKRLAFRIGQQRLCQSSKTRTKFQELHR